MSRTSMVFVALLAAATGGVAGAATTCLLQRGATKPAASANSSPADDDDLAARLDALEAQVARLAQQRATVIMAPQTAPASTETASSRPTAQAVDDPVFEAAVRDVIERMEQDRNAERETRRTERQAQQAKRWADKLAEQASLSEDQKAKVLAVAQQYLDALRQSGQSDGGAVSREERNERRNAARAEAEKQLGAVMSPGQMQAYKGAEGLSLDAMARGGTRRGGQ